MILYFVIFAIIMAVVGGLAGMGVVLFFTYKDIEVDDSVEDLG